MGVGEVEGQAEKILKDAKKTLAELKNIIADLKVQVATTSKELAEYKTIRGLLRTVKLEQKNDWLRKRLRTNEDVISHNNLWPYFSKHKEKAIVKKEISVVDFQ